MLEGTLVCIAINDDIDDLCIRHLNFPKWPDHINRTEVVDYRGSWKNEIKLLCKSIECCQK